MGSEMCIRDSLTRLATPSSVVRLRRLRDVVPSPTLVRLREAAPAASVVVGLPRLLRLPPRLRRRAAAALIMGSAASVLLRLREAAISGAVLVASPPTERRFGGCGAASIA